MHRYASIATAFAFGYFFTLGILTLGWATVHQPKSFELATGLAADRGRVRGPLALRAGARRAAR